MAKLLSLCLAFAVALAAQELLTNERVSALSHSGVTTEELVRIIRTAPSISFDLTPAGTDELLKNGVSEEIVRVMAARELAGVTPTAPAQPLTMPVASPTKPKHQHLVRNLVIIGATGAGLGVLGYELSNRQPSVSCCSPAPFRNN